MQEEPSTFVWKSCGGGGALATPEEEWVRHHCGSAKEDSKDSRKKTHGYFTLYDHKLKSNVPLIKKKTQKT